MAKLSKADAARLNGKKGGRPRKSAPVSAPAVPVVPSPVVVPAVVDNPFKLSPKELVFVELYTGVCELNASKAYEGAGYTPNRHNAARLLMKDNVSAAVAARLSLRLKTLQMSGDEALEGISRIARSDIRKMFTLGGNILPVHTIDDDTADAISSIKVVERRIPNGAGGHEVEYTKEFKLYDKLKARELMARVAGKLVERHEHFGSVDVIHRLAAGRQRVALLKAAGQ